jgi:NAD(P)H-dependent flavin oxidoreductase YrpB (nitropropane dioxygenase family)
MEWKTRVTDLLGCKYPILQGAFGLYGTWQFAAFVADTGAFGTITASNSKTPDELRTAIRNCRKATNGKFGVNLTIGNCPRIEDMLEVCIVEKVPVETSLDKPDGIAPRIKQAGLTWIHKAARVKDAVHAQDAGADAIILVGLEGTGRKSPEQLPTMTTIIWGSRQINVPLIAAGGIGDAHGLLAALGMGADGIMMGTAFMATKECPISDSAKDTIVKTGPDSLKLRQQVMMTGGWKIPVSTKPLPEAGRPQSISFAAGVIDRVPTVRELVDGIIRDAESILNGWQFLKKE